MHRRFLDATALVLLTGCAPQPDDKLEPIDLTVRQKPQVTIASPAAGAFVTPSADGMIDVTGSAHGSSIRINGQTTPVDSAGNFHARIPASDGLNVIDAHLSGLLGGESQRAFLYGHFAEPSALLPSGVMVRSTAAAFDDHQPDLDDYSSIARAMIAQTDLMALVRQLPPFTWTLGSASVDVVLTDVHFAQDKVALSLSPRDGGTHAGGGLQGLSITLKL